MIFWAAIFFLLPFHFAQASCVPAPAGLVGWWPAEGNGFDMINNNTAIAAGGLSYATGKVAKAFQLNGTDAFLRVPASPVLDVGQSNGFTIEAWINPSDQANGHTIAEWNSSPAGGTIGTHLVIGHPTQPAGYFFCNMVDTTNNYHNITVPNGLTSGVFQHVAVTYDKTTGVARLYINGVIVAESNLGIFTPQTSYDFYIGTRPANQFLFAGAEDEVSVYARALDPSEILAIYNAGTAGKCLTPLPPVFYVQPTNQVAAAGATATFTTAVRGTPPFYFRWFLNGTNVAGATNSFLTLTNLQLSQSGNYVAVVTNSATSGNSATSSVAALTVTALVITNQPQDQVGSVGSNVTFSVGVSSALPLSYQWWHDSIRLTGGTNATLTLTNLQTSDAGNYFVVVTNSAGSATSASALLTVYWRAPSISLQPTSRSVAVGGSTTFTVTAGGSPTLSYQWLFGGTELSGATNASLTLTNIQAGQGGPYSVVITNVAGSAVSSNAILTVTLPTANVRVLNTSAVAGGLVVVPVVLEANGNENSVSFSVSFNTGRLTYNSISLGSGAGGAALTVYTNNQIQFGRLGVVVTYPNADTFAPGTQQVAQIVFNSSVLLGGSPVGTPVNFGDTPTVRQLSGPQSQAWPANFVGGTVTLSPSAFEGDVSPRAAGSQTLTSNDWQQAGRFVARLDTAAAGSELQRADCAPRSTLGDGQIKITDWVQAARYAAGLDPLTLAGGPASEVPPVVSSGGIRNLQLMGGATIQGVPITVPVQIQSQGNENAVSFSVGFDPAAFQFVGGTLGAGDLGAVLYVNTNGIASGQIGFALALPAGLAFSPGTRELAKLTFLPGVSGVGTNALTLSDQPAPRGISDPGANELSGNYVNGSIVVNPLPPLAILLDDTNNAVLSWPAWAADFNLQSTPDLLAPAGWTNVAAPRITNGENINATWPAASDAQFFRLSRP